LHAVILDDERQAIVRIQKRPPGAVSAGYCDINYYLLKHALHVAPYGASHRAARPANDATAAIARREFIEVLACSAASWPLATLAQQNVTPTIGYLGTDSVDTVASRVRASRQGLMETNYFEGRNVQIEYRWAGGQNEQLPALAAELVQRGVAVIVSLGGSPSALAAKAATATIPIVFEVGGNPVELRLVSSFNRPGGNVTGVTSLTAEMAPKSA
jgi:ABC-type uncharacterized transport system substrate-binding protein